MAILGTLSLVFGLEAIVCGEVDGLHFHVLFDEAAKEGVVSFYGFDFFFEFYFLGSELFFLDW